MNKYLLFAMALCLFIKVNAQPCVTYEGLGPVQLTYGINVFGQQATSLPVVPLYWNRFYKANETTGQIEPNGCAYPADPNIHELGACACILSGFWFRKVTPDCDPTPCGGDVGLPTLPITNNSNASSNWSAAATWTNVQVPDIAASMAVMITKTTAIDADLVFPANHWLLLSGGTLSLQTGKTVTLNSTIQMKAGTQLINFGTLKGSGKIMGSLTNNGILSPGNSPGKFSITGNYTAGNTAIHQMEIASAVQYDTIAVDQDITAPGGVAVLDGTLSVSLLNGFTPSTGEAYRIMTYASATGTFASINLPVLRPGLSWAVNYNATDITLVVNGVLPVTITSFTVNKKSEGVQTTWTTASEINVGHYEIERGTDGIVFGRQGSVNAAGGASNQYTWFDPAPVNGKNYYRIKSIDLDGTWKHSSTRVIDMTAGHQVSVFPNPVKANEMLQVKLQGMTAIKMDILNSAGQLVYSKTGVFNGVIGIRVSPSWAPGQYILRIMDDKQLLTQKIMIR